MTKAVLLTAEGCQSAAALTGSYILHRLTNQAWQKPIFFMSVSRKRCEHTAGKIALGGRGGTLGEMVD